MDLVEDPEEAKRIINGEMQKQLEAEVKQLEKDVQEMGEKAKEKENQVNQVYIDCHVHYVQ